MSRRSIAIILSTILPCAGFTAYQVLYHKLHIQPGQTILIHGGVGGFAVQLAAKEGLDVPLLPRTLPGFVS